MKLVGAAAVTGVISAARSDAATCVTSPAQTEGPYFVEENLNRSDIRSDPATGVIRPGVLLNLKLTVSQVTNSACGVLPAAHVEIWHCDALGSYSDVAMNNTRSQKYLRGYQVTDENGDILIQDPPIARLLFQNSKASIIWLIVRLYIGYEWLDAGWHKFTDPAWMSTGDGILGFWTRALAVAPNGKPVIAYDWYRNFIQLLAKLRLKPMKAGASGAA